MVSSGVVVLVQAIIVFLVNAHLSNTMTVEDYGQFSVFVGTYILLNTILLQNQHGLTSLYYHRYSQRILAYSLGHYILFIFPMALVVSLLGSHLIGAENYFSLIALSVTMVIPQITNAFFQTSGQFGKFILSGILFHLFLQVPFIFSYQLFGFDGVSHLSIALLLVLSALSLIWHLKHRIIVLSFSFNFKLALSNLRYTLPIVGYSAIMIFYTYLDRFTVDRYLEKKQLAIYSAALLIISIYSLAINITSQTWGIFLFKNFKTSEDPRIFRYLRMVVYGVGIIAPFILFTSSEIFFVFINPEYREAKELLIPLSIGYSLMLYRSIFNGYLDYKKRSLEKMISPAIGIAVFLIGIWFLEVLLDKLDLMNLVYTFAISQFFMLIYVRQMVLLTYGDGFK